MKVLDRKIGLRLLACALAASVSAGCAYIKQSRDRVEPKAVPHMLQSQTLNPDAGRNRKAVAGLDSDAGAYVAEAYSTSFQRTDSQKGSTETFQGLQGLGSE